jgi:hypothetical protein
VNDTVLKNQEDTICTIKKLNIIAENIMVMFFKRFIQVNGYKITFETKVLTDLDFRKYKIIVENNYGEGVFNFILQSASKYIYVIINSIYKYQQRCILHYMPILIYIYCEGQMKPNVI